MQEKLYIFDKIRPRWYTDVNKNEVGDCMIYKSDISSLKRDMEEKIGQKIIVKESPGKRSKPLEKSAIIEQVYPTYFRVKFEENERRSSYNYTDIFTKSVEVQVFDGEHFTALEPPAIISKKNRQEYA